MQPSSDASGPKTGVQLDIFKKNAQLDQLYTFSILPFRIYTNLNSVVDPDP
jgi:hypothetical protein